MEDTLVTVLSILSAVSYSIRWAYLRKGNR